MPRNGDGVFSGQGWRSLAGSVAVALLLFGSGFMGWRALNFALCNNELATFVALALSVFWGAVAAVLLAMRFSARRMRAEMQARVVDQTAELFLDQLKASSGNKSDSSRASRWAELVDRLDGLAAKALENVDRRP